MNAQEQAEAQRRWLDASLMVLQAFQRPWLLGWRTGLTKEECRALNVLSAVYRADVLDLFRHAGVEVNEVQT